MPCCKSGKCIDLGIEGKQHVMQVMSDGDGAKGSRQKGGRQTRGS